MLASYSRDDEREADALGMEYMTRAGYSADGMVGLMDILRKEAREQPSMIETMFASHPMSDERYATAQQTAATKYKASRSAKLKRERYMDNTAGLRALAPAIEAERRGETLLAARKATDAEREFATALKRAPNDYTGLVLMTQTKMMQKQYAQAEPFVDRAVAVYPNEGQALKLGGMVKLAQKKPDVAFQRFDAYDKVLPGNPATAFFKGASMEAMQRRKEAAQLYVQYLRAGGEGPPAQHAQSRLKQWGVIR
jgi:predicted Zn-dependent protease